MEFAFLVGNYDFKALRSHALYIGEKVGVRGIFLAFDQPDCAIKKLFAENAKAPDIALVPDEIGQQEMNAWNGLWVSSESDKEWSFVVTKHSVLGKPYWSINMDFDASHFEFEFVKQLFLELVKRIQPDLAMAYNEVGAPYDVRYFSNELGPWAGLRDVYWLNYYGKDYTDLIGLDPMKESDGVTCVKEVCSGVFFIIDKSRLENRGRIITAIGDEFFIQEKIKGGATESVGIVALIKTLYRLYKDDGSQLAAVRPGGKKGTLPFSE